MLRRMQRSLGEGSVAQLDTALSTAGNQFNSWGFPQVPYSSPGLCRTYIKLPMHLFLYMELTLNDFEAGNPFLGPLEGVGP
jgi:hypothetical protein